MANSWFQFKQFTIHQHAGVFPVGTDGVLLGSWVETPENLRVLDVGTGTAVIALMLAQRGAKAVTGIELQETAFEQAKQNVAKSPWSDRVTILHQDFSRFEASNDLRYDLIVSNPPFFSQATLPPNEVRELARHNHALPFEQLLAGAFKHTHKDGLLSVVLPTDECRAFLEQATTYGWFLSRQTSVIPVASKTANRELLTFRKTAETLHKDNLIIRNADGLYSAAYRSLGKDFYLKF